MSKMRYFNNKFSKITKGWGICTPSAPLTSDFGEINLRDLPKLWFFKLIMYYYYYLRLCVILH